MYHSFLIHSSADEHLGCFHVLAIINSAVMNTGVHVSLSDLETRFLRQRASLVLLLRQSFRANANIQDQKIPLVQMIVSPKTHTKNSRNTFWFEELSFGA